MPTLDQPTKRMAALIETLSQQTLNGAIRWRPTDLPGAFAYVANDGSVIVRGPASGLSYLVTGYSIQVLDRSGNKVEEFATSPLYQSSRALQRLFDEVVRRYSEGDPFLDRLRSEVASKTAP